MDDKKVSEIVSPPKNEHDHKTDSYLWNIRMSVERGLGVASDNVSYCKQREGKNYVVDKIGSSIAATVI